MSRPAGGDRMLVIRNGALIDGSGRPQSLHRRSIFDRPR